MKLSEQQRFGEVDRSERVSQAYRQNGTQLEPIDVEWHVPQWSIQEKLTAWRPLLRDDCVLWGAFEADRLVAFCGYRPNVAPGTGQLALLHVSRPHRRRGIGRTLAGLLVTHARECGDHCLYVTATPTRGTVEMYRSLGFNPTDRPLPELLAMEPDDVHMRMALEPAATGP